MGQELSIHDAICGDFLIRVGHSEALRLIGLRSGKTTDLDANMCWARLYYIRALLETRVIL